MNTDKKYNGWTNYETWLVKLWIDNNEGSQNYWIDRTREIHEAALPDHNFTQSERAALTLMDELKDQHEETAFDQIKADNGFVHDLLNAALGEVNWHEIAESLIEDNCEQSQTEETLRD
jgi:hypothetical protein